MFSFRIFLFAFKTISVYDVNGGGEKIYVHTNITSVYHIFFFLIFQNELRYIYSAIKTK